MTTTPEAALATALDDFGRTDGAMYAPLILAALRSGGFDITPPATPGSSEAGLREALREVESALRNAYGDVSDVWPHFGVLRAALRAPVRSEAADKHGRIDTTEHAECLDAECGAAWLIRREDQWRRRVIEAAARAEGLPGPLDAAWAAAEGALPEGWVIDGLARIYAAGTDANGSDADAWSARAYYHGPRGGPVQVAVKVTPDAALLALADKLLAGGESA